MIKIAAGALFQHKLRSLLSILGVVCGVMTVCAMISIGEGAKKEAILRIEQLGTKNIYIKALTLTQTQTQTARENKSYGLTIHDARRIQKSSPSVREVAGVKELAAAVSGIEKEVSPQVVACSANYASVLNMNVSEGRFLANSDMAQKHLVCVLGNTLARQFGKNGGPGKFIRIENLVFKVVGVLDRNDVKEAKNHPIAIKNHNEMIFIPLGVEKAFRRDLIDGVNQDDANLNEIIVQVHTPGQVMNTAAIISRTLEVSHNQVQDYQIIIPEELLKQARSTRRIFNIVLGTIAGVSLIAGGIGVMNIMLATVSERTKEIGIRRAVGATRQHIATQFIAEAVILTFVGGVMGIGAGIGAIHLIAVFAAWKTAVTLWALLVPLIMSILVGIFFGLYPAMKAARMNPIDALRHE
jgi:putative ABC transport system permease protein